MFWKSRAISAHKIASDYVAGANSFLDRLIEVCARLEDGPGGPDARRREGCAALWAATVAAVEGSSLSEEDRKKLLPLMAKAFLPYWREHCGEGSPLEQTQRYLINRDSSSYLRTAVGVTEALLEAWNASEQGKIALRRFLAAMFAHRMLSDVQRFNDIKANFTIK